MEKKSPGMIEHKGIVSEVGPQGMRVRILAESACSSCHAKELCGLAESRDKEIDIRGWKGEYRPGEEVRVLMKKSMGMKALSYGYLLPFLLVFTTLLIFSLMGLSELMAGLFSLSVLLPYYLILYLFRKHLRRVFHFFVEKSV